MKTNIQPLVFIITNDQSLRMMLKHALINSNIRKIKSFISVEDSISEMKRHPDIVIYDGKNDMHIARIEMARIKKECHNCDIILLSDTNTILAAISVMRDGASDLIEKNAEVIKRALKSVKYLLRKKYQRQIKLADAIITGWSVAVGLLIFLYFII